MNTKVLIYFLILISAFTVGIIKFRKLNIVSKVIFFLLAYTIVSESIAYILKITVKNNLIVFHFYNIVNYGLITVAFSKELKAKRYLYISIFLYTIFAIINGFFLQPFFDKYCSNTYLIGIILISIYCLFYMYLLLKEDTENSFTEYPLFWISLGLLTHNIVNILSLGSFNVLSLDKDLTKILGLIRTFSNYVLYFTFIIAFYSKQKKII